MRSLNIFLGALCAIALIESAHAEPNIVRRHGPSIQMNHIVVCEDLNAPNPSGRGFPAIPETGELTPEGYAEFQSMLKARFPDCPATDNPTSEAR
ncbi:hypothetical protein QDD76_007076 [Burkholderia cepacia]|uniref:hypothetical protein n=1 Tax=Burkholderia sp. AU27893 TaxID=2015351 RepID=UPI0011785F88|nr:hypothetical protein [Burkholderia sp. AU27893]EKS9808561.1 hypothetical protein [Burkholderia cepacia]EKS9815534.1 hypothetical protein [Burkholderia cepacia]